MVDDVTLNAGSGGASIRTLDRGDSKGERQVVAFDLGGATTNAENIFTIGSQLRANSLSQTRAQDEPYTQAEQLIVSLLQQLIGQNVVSPFQDLAANIRNALIEVVSHFNYASSIAPVLGAFNATGTSAVFQPLYGKSFNVSGWGTFAATAQLERTFDGGTNWLPLTVGGSAQFVWTAPFSESQVDDEVGVIYRLRCTAYTSGTLNYRLSC